MNIWIESATIVASNYRFEPAWLSTVPILSADSRQPPNGLGRGNPRKRPKPDAFGGRATPQLAPAGRSDRPGMHMMDFAQEFTRKRRDELHLDEVIAEADRQITICNACRYCEGYCAVFPAIERRATFTPGDIAHLSNLCHDCRACYYACMHVPPHEFAVNIPEILSKVRIRTYDNYLGAGSDWLRRRLKGRTPIALTAALSLVLFVAVAGATEGVSALWHRPSTGSPYEVIPYGVL